MKKQFAVWLTLAAVLWVSACTKDDDHDDQDITIEFLSPTDGATVSADSVDIHIRLTASEENEDTDIRLYAENDPAQVLLSAEIHEHEPVVEYRQAVDLSAFPAGTAFILAVEACLDHDCEHSKDDSIRFTIN